MYASMLVVCLQIVSDAEAWLAKLKRVLVSSSNTTSTGNAAIKAGSTLSRLCDLLAEGRRVPVNLDYEMRPLKAAIEAAQEWLQQHGELLGALGITDVPADTAAGAGVVKTEKVPYEKLFACVNAASGINATFPELTAARVMLREADEWLVAATERCERPQHQPHRRAGKSTDQASQGRASAGKRKGQQAIDNQDIDQDSVSQDQDEATAMPSSYDEPVATASFSSSAPHRDVLLALLARGQGLGVDVSDEMEMIQGALAAIDEWESTAGQALRDLDMQVAPVVQGYRQLAKLTPSPQTEEATSLLMPPLPFPSFEAANLDDYDGDDGDDDDDGGESAFDDSSKTKAKAADTNNDKVQVGDKHKDKVNDDNETRDGEEEEALAAALRLCVEEEADQWCKFVDFYVEIQRMQREANELGVGLPQTSATSSKGKGKEDQGHGHGYGPNSFVTLELSAAALYWIYSVRKLLLYPSMQSSDDPRLITNVPTSSSSHNSITNGGSRGKGEANIRPNKKKDKKSSVSTAAADAGASVVAGVKTEDSSSSSSMDVGGTSGGGDGIDASDAAESPRGLGGGGGSGTLSDLGFGDVPLDLIQTLIRDAETYFEAIAMTAVDPGSDSSDGGNGLGDSSSLVVGRLAAMEAVYASSALANTPPPPPSSSANMAIDADADDTAAGTGTGYAGETGCEDMDGAAATRKRRKIDTGEEGGDDDDDGQDDADGDGGGGGDSSTAMMTMGAEDAADGQELDGNDNDNDNNGKRKKRTVTTREDSTTSNYAEVSIASSNRPTDLPRTS